MPHCHMCFYKKIIVLCSLANRSEWEGGRPGKLRVEAVKDENSYHSLLRIEINLQATWSTV